MPDLTTDSFPRFLYRVTFAHTATYLVAGLLASTLLDYRSWWASEYFAHYRGFDSPWIPLAA